MRCPIKIPKAVRMCEVCMFSKNGICDYPYYRGMSESDIKKLTKSLGGKE